MSRARRRPSWFGLKSVSRAKHGVARRSVLEQAEVVEAEGAGRRQLRADPLHREHRRRREIAWRRVPERQRLGHTLRKYPYLRRRDQRERGGGSEGVAERAIRLLEGQGYGVVAAPVIEE